MVWLYQKENLQNQVNHFDFFSLAWGVGRKKVSCQHVERTWRKMLWRYFTKFFFTPSSFPAFACPIMQIEYLSNALIQFYDEILFENAKLLYLLNMHRRQRTIYQCNNDECFSKDESFSFFFLYIYINIWILYRDLSVAFFPMFKWWNKKMRCLLLRK